MRKGIICFVKKYKNAVIVYYDGMENSFIIIFYQKDKEREESGNVSL